jgi:hypothetical protein
MVVQHCIHSHQRKLILSYNLFKVTMVDVHQPESSLNVVGSLFDRPETVQYIGRSRHGF